MKLHEYLESTYVSTNVDIQVNYDPYLQAKTQSCQNLLHLQKFIFRLIAYPSIIIEYLLVRCHLREAPPLAQDLVKVYNNKCQPIS